MDVVEMDKSIHVTLHYIKAIYSGLSKNLTIIVFGKILLTEKYPGLGWELLAGTYLTLSVNRLDSDSRRQLAISGCQQYSNVWHMSLIKPCRLRSLQQPHTRETLIQQIACKSHILHYLHPPKADTELPFCMWSIIKYPMVWAQPQGEKCPTQLLDTWDMPPPP